jgi:hypothetical protein
MPATSLRCARPPARWAAAGHDEAAGGISAGEAERLKVLARFMLSPLYGILIGLAFIGPWLVLGRTLTARSAFASLCFVLAAALAAGCTSAAMRIVVRRPWSARFAAALFILIAGTAGLATLFMTLGRLLAYDHVMQIPLRWVVIVIGTAGATTLYDVLSIAAPMMLPFALPLVVLFALLFARPPR